MFTIYSYCVNGHKRDTYFKSWENAKAALQEDLQRLLKDGSKIESHIDRFRSDKGFYEYEYKLFYPDAPANISLALIDGYFSD